MKLARMILAPLAFAAFAAHAGPNADIVNAAATIVIQTYNDLAAGTAKTEADLQALKAQPDEAHLQVAQQDWYNMRVSWEISEAFLYGPVESLNIDDSIDNWPIDLTGLKALLASSSPVSVDAISGLGSNMRGFHGIEYILFGDGTNGPNKTAAQLTARQIEYALSCATIVADRTALLAHSWSTNADPDHPKLLGYGHYLANPAPTGNPYYRSEGASMTQLVNGILSITEEVGKGKLTQTDPTKVESPYSWNSLNDFQNNIRSAKNIWNGTYNGQTVGPGLRRFVASRDAALARAIDAEIDAAIDAIANIAGDAHLDFRQAVVDPQGQVRCKQAEAAVLSLDHDVRTKVMRLVSTL